VLISKLNGVSVIGKLPGFAMAASEDERVPTPSVEVPEGGRHAYKRKGVTADNLFDRLNNLKVTAIALVFLEP